MITAYITLPTSGSVVALQYSASFGEVAIICLLIVVAAIDAGRLVYQFSRDVMASRVSQFVTQTSFDSRRKEA